MEQSRNSWIKKDGDDNGAYKSGFEDILVERRKDSDLQFVLRKRANVPCYKYNVPRCPVEVHEHVLSSDRVKYALEKALEETELSRDELLKEVKGILDEMAHTFSMGAVRFLAFFITKIFKKLFGRLYVNEEGMQRLHKLMHEYPVLLMPSHRSYMDFLLVSYVFYHYDLPLPVIAAAMDFKGMKFFGWLLRNCGAFYIRRSFGTDRLYWAVFTEYVQTQLRNGDYPIEFFVEGTRSRTSKSYVPRIGMLSAALESYFKAEVSDILAVPISISYEKILEERLYAYELLGIPKPKESTSGLLKARGILAEDFGSVHFYVGEPISIRQFSVNVINRVSHALEPRYINSLTPEEAALSHRLACHVVRLQQSHMIISPWSLMAAVFMQTREGVSIKQLVKEVEWLKRQASNLGAYVDWPNKLSTEAIVKHCLTLHTDVVNVHEDVVQLKLIRPPQDAPHSKLLASDVMLNSATNLVLASYRNQLMHVFIRVAMVTLVVNGCVEDFLSLDELFRRYEFLEKLFSVDFIFQRGETRQDFHEALLSLTHSGGLVVNDDKVTVKKSINKQTTFLSQMFEPFIVGYWIVCQHLLTLTSDVNGRPLPKKPKDLARDTQTLGMRLVQENVVRHSEVLSLDLLSNGLMVLANMGAMYKDKRNDETWLSPNNVSVFRIAEELGKFVELPQVDMTNFSEKKRTQLLAKM